MGPHSRISWSRVWEVVEVVVVEVVVVVVFVFCCCFGR